MLSFTNHLKNFLDWDKLSQEQNLTARFKPLGVFGSYNLRFSHSKDSSSSSMDIEDEKHGFVVTSLEVRIIAIMLSRYEQLREDSRLAAQAAAKEKARATELLK